MKQLLAIIGFCSLIFSLQAQNLIKRDQLNFSAWANDVWGYEADGKEYAIVGTTSGVAIVDVTNPDDIEQIHFIAGNSCTWRDIKVFGQYAYVTQDCESEFAGLVIIDLSNIGVSIERKQWRTDGTTPLLKSAHNIFIDEFGYAYICGHNFGAGGVLILDLNADPWNPTVVGSYEEHYVHDLYVRDNIMYTAEIFAGKFAIIDATDKSDLKTLARQATPVEQSHNIWISEDGKTAFTTDETEDVNVSIAAYDISDLSDITLLNEYQSNPSAVPHNATVLGDFVIASHYSYGVVVLDGSQPDEMVEVAHFDTEPALQGNIFLGCWGVYPYLSSGNILASDQREGLFVFTPDYKKAIHIRGTVKHAITSADLFNANIKISSDESNYSTESDLEGFFKKGFAIANNYSIEVELDGFHKYKQNLGMLEHGDVVELDIKMIPIGNEVSQTESIEINSTNTFCAENSSDIDIENTFSCDNDTSSAVGTWSISSNGCLEYSAGATSGNEIDTVCITISDASGNEVETIEFIVSIIDNTTTSHLENSLLNGEFKLLQNPANNFLYVQNQRSEKSSIELEVFDINGSSVLQMVDSGFNEIISMDISHLQKGIYILTLQTTEGGSGFIRFIKH